MFERTLQDLIRGLRAHKASSKAAEDAFLAEAMVEMREELKGKDMALKAEGVLKMCYLMMLYPIPPPSGFAFHVVEVMSSPRYHLKQLGYLAAPMAFSGETEEVVLTVNGIKKDLMSPHLAIPPLPLTALPHLLAMSPSLANTLHPDLLHLLTHSSPRIRKRAVLCLLPCWEAYPDGLREGFARLRERLQDEDQGVVGTTVGVVMELARRQGGKNYLPLAPELFAILTGSSNNWMLIKVVKLFAILTPLEPRLVRKLLPPITNLISSTSAISLLYECVRTCIVGGMLDPDRAEGEALARVCVEKLGGYLRDEGGDQNLRYIALLAMVKIIPTHPQMVAEYQEEVLQSLDDPDVSIRMRALELVTSMVDRYNMRSIVDQLLAHLAPPSNNSSLPSAIAALAAAAGAVAPTSATTAQTLSLTPAYRLLLAQRLLGIIAHDTYSNVPDFQWAVSVLIDVAYISQVDVGAEIRDMLLDIIGRVRSVRDYAVSVFEDKVIGDEDYRERGREGTGEDGLLEAAVWICGEYPSELSSPLSSISSILSPTLHLSSPNLIALSLQAVAKIFGFHTAAASSSWSADRHTETKNLVASVQGGIATFTSHNDIEVQERAAELLQLLNFVHADVSSHTTPKRAVNGDDDMTGIEGGFVAESSGPAYPKSLFLFQPLFTSHELNAVAYRAQEAVQLPEGLDLDREIIPGGGFGETDVEDERDESEVEKERSDLREGGGAGMEELRRLLREQDDVERNAKGKTAKKKGKNKKTEGELRSVEEKEERARRKAAKKARAKNDPYYLYDEKADADDVDDIPIVRLDDVDLVSTGADQAAGMIRKSQQKPQAHEDAVARPQIDSGELPDGASPIPSPRPPNSERVLSGLAAIDINDASRTSSTSRFEEYKLDDEKDGGVGTNGYGTEQGDVPTPVGEIEVVRVKRKKKASSKKRVVDET